MNFASSSFFVFSICVLLVLNFLTPRHRNWGWILANAIFIGCLDTQYLIIYPLLTFFNFLIALKIQKTSKDSFKLVILSISLNFGALLFSRFQNATSQDLVFRTISLLSLSFFVLQIQSYIFDVSRRTIEATRNFAELLAFSTFFLTLQSGPIERYGHLSTQLKAPVPMTPIRISEAVFLISLGLFKRLVLVSQLYRLVPVGLGNINEFSGLSLMTYCVLAFSQMYLDFSSYVDIARGLALLGGVDLFPNFYLPYLARNPFDLWRRWHISFNTWLRDYLYIPLLLRTKSFYLALTGVFVFVGVWHNFRTSTLVWILYWILILFLYRFIRIKPEFKKISSILIFGTWFSTFLLASLSSLAIASTSFEHFLRLWSRLFVQQGSGLSQIAHLWPQEFKGFFIFLSLLVLGCVFEVLHLTSAVKLSLITQLVLNLLLASLLIFLTAIFGQNVDYRFIYFVF